MKKAHNLNKENKLTLDKLKVTKLDDLLKIKGGGVANEGLDDDKDTWPA